MLSPEQLSKNYAKYKIKNRIQHFYRSKEIRKMILKSLGNKCVFCGEENDDYLEIDHVNNDGYIEGRNRKSWLNKYKQGEITKEKYQILCANCHRKKTKIYSELKSMETLGIRGFA